MVVKFFHLRFGRGPSSKRGNKDLSEKRKSNHFTAMVNDPKVPWLSFLKHLLHNQGGQVRTCRAAVTSGEVAAAVARDQ